MKETMFMSTFDDKFIIIHDSVMSTLQNAIHLFDISENVAYLYRCVRCASQHCTAGLRSIAVALVSYIPSVLNTPLRRQ